MLFQPKLFIVMTNQETGQELTNVLLMATSLDMIIEGIELMFIKGHQMEMLLNMTIKVTN